VLGVQRALVKLGFVLRPDGVNGAATRQALEQFERDHNLPSKGELTPKVLRELATQSGQTIE
jgi:peptidoglycan hydrolase-like protein with peptidoglycan-binding domain